MSAQILPFVRQSHSRTFARKADPAVAMGSVVILPCVRYERWEAELSETPAKSPVLSAPACH